MTMKKTAWVTGAAGLIGNYVVRAASKYAPECEVHGLTRAELDLLDFDAVTRAFNKDSPQLIIHCAALTRTPQCQANPELARRSNVNVTRMLAELARDIPFIFLSTDLVFDGKTGNYDENSVPNPINVYAETKLVAEKIVLANPRHTVLRVSLNAGASLTGDRSFTEETRRSWEAGKLVTLFTDEFRCPIPAVVTARVVWELVRLGAVGLYHVAGSERLSRYEIGKLLAVRWPHLEVKIIPGSVKDFKGAPRSPDVTLNCSKVQKILSFQLPKFSEWLVLNPDEPI
jgi:dTDP-4-dehydrorhamnose reductase